MDPHQALRRIFGFEQFRPGQAEAVDAACSDRDALIVMPTGSGKSLCYQLPALMREDLTLVVSPLVSLMADQVQALRKIAPGRVELVNAQQGHAENTLALERASRGEARLLYVAPERFASPGFAEALGGAQVGLFVVDEAHCVSQWGHDFRPDYFSLADAARDLGARATIALTATATPRVAADIAGRLALRDPVRVSTGFDRPNLSFAVVQCASPADRGRRIAAALSERGALPAIVYAGTRNASEQLASSLAAALGEEVAPYHAGLDRGARALIQERFMTAETRVIVATNAFGMGIDKADVRTVCHAGVPGSVEAYYQEAGRAGRDSAPARCLLFAEQRDKGLHVFFIQRAALPDDALQRISERLRWAGIDGRYDLPLSDLRGQTGARSDEDAVRAIIGHLARAGLVSPEPSARDRARGQVVGSWDARALSICRESVREAERVRWSHYRAVWEYVERPQCRRMALLRHFGDRSEPAPAAACCDTCDGAPEEWAAPSPRSQAGPLKSRSRGRSRKLRSGAGPRVVACSEASADVGGLDQAIMQVVRTASPAVGRTRAVEILRGGRSKVIIERSYDDLPSYGAFAHLRGTTVLGRVDELLAGGALASSGGRFPKLRAT